ncbi:MAG: GreA/GreB family elongation factor [Lachnospiraceae bacterium]|nr:GreA/GreB family elongation factor [Lachnospiraceae bacterium]
MYDKVTQKDIKRMEEEIERRKLVVRKEALDAVKEARAQGDLSENFEYKAAKQFKNENEKRIRYLERMIKTAVVISDESKSDEVGMNNKVVLLFEDEDEEEEYTIVTTVRANSMKRWISNESPLGKAVFGHKAGDRVYVQISEHEGYYVTIRSIENTDDDGSIGLRKY